MKNIKKVKCDTCGEKGKQMYGLSYVNKGIKENHCEKCIHTANFRIQNMMQLEQLSQKWEVMNKKSHSVLLNVTRP